MSAAHSSPMRHPKKEFKLNQNHSGEDSEVILSVVWLSKGSLK